MNRILVTSGARFLGSHICERLLNDSCLMLRVDNLHTGSKSNIEHLLPNLNFSQVADVREGAS